jgi:hypothetical protein
MENKFNKRGMEFVPKNIVSDEAKLKLNKLMENKAKHLNKLVEDYNAGILVSQ